MVFLSACGEGGTSVAPLPSPPSAPKPTPTPTPTPAPTPTPTSTPAPAVNYNTTEYKASTYALAADALTAYNAGATGQGVKIGIVDSGINPALSDFAGRIDPASGDVAGTRGVSDEGGHGTAVSSVAAGARNNSGVMGVAFNAIIVSERADQVGSCASKDGCSFYDDAIAAGIDAARLAGVKVINMSLGGSAPGPDLLAAMRRAVDAGIVLVIAAGNDSTANPDLFALNPAKQFDGSVIIAGSIGVLGSNNTIDSSLISTFSDRAGTGAAWYLTALGLDDRAPDQNGTPYLWSGTSFSAPTISGAVALLAQAFPNLTGKQIVQLLFNSADDLGDAGVDSIFGHGRLNIGRAFLPSGATSLASGQTPVSLTSNGALPAVAGDANTTQSLGAVILDGYSRAYILNLARTLSRAPSETPLAQALHNDIRASSTQAGPVSIAMTVRQRSDLADGFALERTGIGPEDLRRSKLIAGSAVARIDQQTAVAFGFAQGAKAMERRLNGAGADSFLIAKDIAGDPGFSAARGQSIAVRHQFGGTGVTASGETGSVFQPIDPGLDRSPYSWTSIALDRTLGRNWLSVGMSRLDEKASLLGGRMSSALGGGGSGSLFVDAEARRDLGGGWSAALSARRGWTSFAAGSFRTGAYGLDIGKTGLFGAADRLGLRFSQPLRVENGGFSLLLPTGYDYATETATSALRTMSLRPSGREMDGELSYGSTVLGGNAYLGGNLFYRRQPGHIAAAPGDAGAALRFTVGF
ncbi:MAG: S8 family peptidase [Sphingomicrobium sp.]